MIRALMPCALLSVTASMGVPSDKFPKAARTAVAPHEAIGIDADKTAAHAITRRVFQLFWRKCVT